MDVPPVVLDLDALSFPGLLSVQPDEASYKNRSRLGLIDRGVLPPEGSPFPKLLLE